MGTGTVAVKKVPRSPTTANSAVEPAADDGFDRAAVLERLFALPLPPLRYTYRGNRSYPIDQPLGRIMRLRGLQKRDMASFPGVPNDRVLTEMLAGRRDVANYRTALAAALDVDPRVL